MNTQTDATEKNGKTAFKNFFRNAFLAFAFSLLFEAVFFGVYILLSVVGLRYVYISLFEKNWPAICGFAVLYLVLWVAGVILLFFAGRKCLRNVRNAPFTFFSLVFFEIGKWVILDWIISSEASMIAFVSIAYEAAAYLLEFFIGIRVPRGYAVYYLTGLIPFAAMFLGLISKREQSEREEN